MRKKVKVMESVTLKKSINWERILGSTPKIKNCKIIIFGDNSEKEMTMTRIVKIKIGDQEYILNHYISEELEEIEIKNNRALLLLKLKYDKKNNELNKQLNYDFTEVITYFLVEFFGNRLKDDKEFKDIKEYLNKYEEISLDISENSI